jgi:putative nucleotidyltransferase with HDIG domain
VTRRQGLILAAQVSVLCIALTAAVLTSDVADWQPIELVALLFVLAVGSDVLTVEIRGVWISGSFVALVLAMALLGPLPASMIGIGSILIDVIRYPRSWDRGLQNVVTYATFPVVGAIAIQMLGGDVAPGSSGGFGFAAIVLGVFMVTNFVNFAMIAVFQHVALGVPFMRNLKSVWLTVQPTQLATGLLTAGVAYSYSQIGVGAVGLLAVVLFIFQNLLRVVLQAFERGEELSNRTRELASLQMGLLTTVIQTLSMRDPMTARHSAAVARYSREVAKMLGLDEREQDLIHTAALLHDIGKFIFPDSILFADRKLTDEEWETVKLHPEQGARLVRRIEGYGPVADIIYCHHERYDGNGYYRVPLEQVPLGSRIIAAADTYDVMTSRDSYRRPVSSEAALAELRRVAGSQLDPLVVETFETMVLERGIAFRHTDEADFEMELAFDKRVADYARPRLSVA